jgi:DNA anti-recombination protein RmuC
MSGKPDASVHALDDAPTSSERFERIRDLLLGDAVRALETRLVSSEGRLRRDMAASRSALEQALQTQDEASGRLQKEFELQNLDLDAQHASLDTRIRKLTGDLEESMRLIRAEHDAALRDMHQSVQHRLEEFAEVLAKQQAEMEAMVSALSDRELDREALGQALTALGHALSAGPAEPKPAGPGPDRAGGNDG